MSLLASLKSHTWAYPALEVVHIVGIALLLGNLLALEMRLWLRSSTLPLDAMARLTLRLAGTGFGLAATSGLLMFSTQAGDLLANRVFLAKMALIALAGCNAVLFHLRGSLQKDDTTARLLMLVSTALWLGIVACGRWIAY